MSLCLILRVDRRLLDLREDRFFESFFSLRYRVDGVLRARHRDKDGDRVNVPMKCNLDREDHVSPCSLCLLTSRLESRDEILV